MKQCAQCSKTYKNMGTRVLLRGHYNVTKSSRKRANLQWSTMKGATGRVKLCTNCIRTNKKK